MKKKSLLAVLALALLASTGCTAYVEDPSWRPPTAEIEVSYFYDALAPYGDWIRVEPWGRVWTPWGVEAGWRPYTYGHWAWTSLGWTWVSDEPWGWAPLPPNARWRIGVGLELGVVDISLSIVEHGWCFVHNRDFLEPRIWRRLEPLPRHHRLLRETRDRTRYEEIDRRVAVRGIPVEEIERGALRKEVEREKQVQDSQRERQARQKPAVKEKTAAKEKPAAKPKPRVKPPKPEGRR